MVTEHFQAVALPKSHADDAEYHVSVFVGPDLVPDGGEGLLEDFEHFPHWASLLVDGDAVVELRDQAGPVDAKPRLDQISPDVWDALFPADTPVRAKAAPEFAGRRWRTFRAAVPHDTAKLMHLVAMFSDPTTPPAPSRHPFGVLFQRLFDFVTDGHQGREWDESVVTRSLDRAIGETGPDGPSLAQIEKELETLDPMTRFTRELHRARRFYERPESAGGYRERPIDGHSNPPPPRPEPDFHERCALVADNPSLQRHLGLVIDLVVADPARLRDAQWIAARITPNGDASVSIGSRTRVATAGEDLVTVATSSDWRDAAMRLGDTERYAVLDMDPDGTALKLDRYFWSFPRLLNIEDNGDPVHAAPTALRSIGFTVVRHQKGLDVQDRMGRQMSLASTPANQPLLSTEDVTQGMRVDVWDDTAKGWFSLHERRITAEVVGHGAVVKDEYEEGFMQGATLTETVGVEASPVHVHEALFGWQGWSLSATRPGKRVRHENGEEIVEDHDVDPDPVTPLVVETAVEPGSLPRLRYGRSYAFRTWAVDLAGNSRSRSLGSPPPPPPEAVEAVRSVIGAAPNVPAAAAGLIPILRADTTAVLMRRRLDVPDSVEPRIGDVSPLLDVPEIDGAVLRRLRERRRSTILAEREGSRDSTAGRGRSVNESFTDVAIDDRHPLIVETAVLDAETLAHSLEWRPDLEPAPDLVNTVTPLRPFLRWDPVQPPTVIAKHPYSEGESLLHVVVRSGVTQDLDSLEITVNPPATFSATSGYRATSERHVAPPKTSQTEAEAHGAFDRAIGSLDPANHAHLLAAAVRERGTWFDVEVPRLDDPTVADPQPGIALANDPTVPPSTLKALPLPQGDMPATGQYVIHDTDEVALPYLPDVVARGISLVFPEAGTDRQIVFPFGTEGFTARFAGRWPALRPFRLVLEGSQRLTGRLTGRTLRIGLPPGDIQRFRLASSLDPADLDLFGLWRILPPVLRENPDIVEAAADGWLWAFTPYDRVSLVHAVPRPLEAPRPTKLLAIRTREGATDAALIGAVDIHGPSTDSLSVEASWTDQVDDLSLPAPEDRPVTGIGFSTMVREEEDLAVLGAGSKDLRLVVPGFGPVWVHSAVHKLNDTRHRMITYRFRASTRFREYFDGATLMPTGGSTSDGVADDGQSVLGPATLLSVPSSAKPAPPVVHSVIPLFRWDAETEPEQPVATRRTRRSGVRIYLERPWYSSGRDELLGVLVARSGSDSGVDGLVSQWGADPVWLSDGVDRRAMLLEFDNLMRTVGLDDRPGDAMPIGPPADLPLATEPLEPIVTVLGYRPQFNVARGLWYVDVAIEPGAKFWPFVRLAVARYQPESIAGCHLSKPVRCDFVQLTPERTATVSRTDVRHVRVVVSGPVGVRDGMDPGSDFPGPLELPSAVGANRRVIARLQRVDPEIPTDLGWETIDTVELEVRGLAGNAFSPAWVGNLSSPVNIPLRRPGSSKRWRVVVEEWERFEGDPESLAFSRPPRPPVWEHRLIYADEIAL